MSSIKVYWVVSNYPGAHNAQAGLFYRHLAEAVVKAGVDLTVIAPVPRVPWPLRWLGSRWNAYSRALTEEVQNGVRVLRPRYFSLPGQANRPSVAQQLCEVISGLSLPQPDLVHGFGAFPMSRTATLMAAQWAIPCCTTFIGSDVNAIRKDAQPMFDEFFKTVKESARVFGVSHALIERVKQLTGIDGDVMYMPVQLTAGDTTRWEAWLKEKENEGRKFRLLFAGNVSAAKGIPELCEALRSIPASQLQLVVCGNAGDAMNNIQSLPHARYAGALPHEDVIALMHCCDALVLPSHSEGIPGVVKEAGLTGLPVIATRVGGIPEIVNEQTASLVEVNDVAGLRQKIEWHMKHPQEAAAKAQQLKQQLEGKFDADRIATVLANRYRELMAQT